MNWEAVGAMGEIVGALAVFATLVYLAIQIRQNTRAVRAAALDSSIQAASLIRSDMFKSEELSQLFLLGNENPEDFNEVQRYRYRNLVSNMMWALWNFYSQSRYADLSQDSWESQKYVAARILNTPGGAWYWKNYSREFEDDFVEAVNQIVEDENCEIDTHNK